VHHNPDARSEISALARPRRKRISDPIHGATPCGAAWRSWLRLTLAANAVHEGARRAEATDQSRETACGSQGKRSLLGRGRAHQRCRVVRIARWGTRSMERHDARRGKSTAVVNDEASRGSDSEVHAVREIDEDDVTAAGSAKDSRRHYRRLRGLSPQSLPYAPARLPLPARPSG
jgi:hypothetical protein